MPINRLLLTLAFMTSAPGLVDRGVFDFSERTPIYAELVALVAWAQE